MITEHNVPLNFEKIFIQNIEPGWLKSTVRLDMLRLDCIHPVISGNKFFKLKYYLHHAKENGYDTIGTYGGAYSNHIVATAYACKISGFKSIGIIRGERPAILSQTLQMATAYGMDLHFISRTDFRKKELPVKRGEHLYLIPEGGYGPLGAKGTAEILLYVPFAMEYTHIICAAGTGTMTAGIVNAADAGQQVICISVLKGNNSLQHSISCLLTDKGRMNNFMLLHDFHFGGYAKKNRELLDFMIETWNCLSVPTDLVYTAKMLFGVKHLAINNHFAGGSKVLMIHSGGLQGNSSLPPGTLPF